MTELTEERIEQLIEHCLGGTVLTNQSELLCLATMARALLKLRERIEAEAHKWASCGAGMTARMLRALLTEPTPEDQ